MLVVFECTLIEGWSIGWRVSVWLHFNCKEGVWAMVVHRQLLRTRSIIFMRRWKPQFGTALCFGNWCGLFVAIADDGCKCRNSTPPRFITIITIHISNCFQHQSWLPNYFLYIKLFKDLNAYWFTYYRWTLLRNKWEPLWTSSSISEICLLLHMSITANQP